MAQYTDANKDIVVPMVVARRRGGGILGLTITVMNSVKNVLERYKRPKLNEQYNKTFRINQTREN